MTLGRDELEKRLKTVFITVHKECCGTGPGRIFVQVIRNMVVIKLEQCFTPFEKSLTMDPSSFSLIKSIREHIVQKFIISDQVQQLVGTAIVQMLVHVHTVRETVYCMLITDGEIPTE